MNQRNKKLLEKINDLSCAIEGLCNVGWHIEKELYGNDIYIYGGKIFKSRIKWEKQYEKGEFEVEFDEDHNTLSKDFRDWKRIDPRIPQYAFDLICFKCKEIYNNFRNEEFTLYVGAAINLYYYSGIHTSLGDFDIIKIIDFIIEERLRSYLNCLYECIRARVWLYAKAIYDETVEEYGFDLKSGKLLSNMIADDKKNINYLPDIVYYEKNMKNKPEELEVLHEKLIKIEPEYRIGQIYKCVSDVKDTYKSDSMRKNYLKYASILGIDFYNHVIGKPKFFDMTFCIVDGKLEIDTFFDEPFGLGIPYLVIQDGIVCYTETGEYVIASRELKDDLVRRIDDDMQTWTYDGDPEMQKIHEEFLKENEEEEKNYVYTFSDVRESMNPYLGLGEVLDRPLMSEYIQGIESSYSGEYDYIGVNGHTYTNDDTCDTRKCKCIAHVCHYIEYEHYIEEQCDISSKTKPSVNDEHDNQYKQ